MQFHILLCSCLIATAAELYVAILSFSVRCTIYIEKVQCLSQDPQIIMGDCNTKEGEGREWNVAESHGFSIRDLRGETLIEWCHTNNLNPQQEEDGHGKA